MFLIPRYRAYRPIPTLYHIIRNLRTNICQSKYTANCFATVAVCMGLWLLKTTVSVSSNDDINDVYANAGVESIELSCGDVPENATLIDWNIKKSDEWKMILKFEHIKPGTAAEYYYNYSQEKYDISESVHTSLVVKNVQLSDTGLFNCKTRGASQAYSYITSLKIVGKSVLQNPIYYILDYIINMTDLHMEPIIDQASDRMVITIITR